ncbi:MAG: LD-carboxypeptidase, partial [Candidatus Izemoplasmatales bacterium]
GERYAEEPNIIRKYDLFPTPEEMTNRILFLETSEEQPSPNKFREMLMRLDQEGILNAPKAILVGKPQNERYFEEYQSILLDCTKKGNIPILYNLNFGHAHPKTVLPLGVKAKIDFDQKRIFLLESMFDDSSK